MAPSVNIDSTFQTLLSAFLQDYLAHIIDVSNLPIRPEQVCALFGNIEDLYEFNRWVTTTKTSDNILMVLLEIASTIRIAG